MALGAVQILKSRACAKALWSEGHSPFKNQKGLCVGVQSESEGLGEVKGCGGGPRRGSKGLGSRVFSAGMSTEQMWGLLRAAWLR